MKSIGLNSSLLFLVLKSDYWNPDRMTRARAVTRTMDEWHARFGNAVQGPSRETVIRTMTRQDEKGSVGYK